MSAQHWLKYLTAEGIVLAQTRIAGDWGVQIGGRDATFYHFVVEGTAYLKVDGVQLVEVQPGDVVLLPHGSPHLVLHSPDSEVVPLMDFLQANNGVFSPAAGATKMICGSVGIDRFMVLPAIGSLPDVVHIRESESPAADILSQLRSEVERSGVASDVIIRHLLAVLFIYVLREWSETEPARRGRWFAAMQNPHVGKALEQIHEHPSRPWSLDALASEAGLSRTVFARQFRETVGETPYAYLARWRIGIAAQLLDQTRLTLAEIAARVGYSSEYSFSRAFKQARGVSPIRARERRRVSQRLG
ncbi:AraC family transcriptional regulator [Pseudomonas sp. LS-2]|jgi:AraC family transcriptional activator of mtrCDE|uniref:AraC family transcriptional regulator n=1 Tax=Pseudomonas sp. LS-2 TaxID=2315859 RepID=UPI001404F512|nr:AraC family transcriptional regulator [Pseudomonas sp. LS-2]